MATLEQIETGIGLVTKALDLVKGLANIKDIPVKRKLDELEGQLYEIKSAYRSTLEENDALRRSLKFKEDSYFRDNARWTRAEDGGEEGPFCSACWDTKKLAVRMTEVGERGHFDCNACGTKNICVLKEKERAHDEEQRARLQAHNATILGTARPWDRQY